LANGSIAFLGEDEAQSVVENRRAAAARRFAASAQAFLRERRS